MGELHVEKATTLGEEIDAVLNRLRASSLSPSTIEFYERSATIWEAFRSTRVASLRRAEVQDFIVARAAAHGRSAKNELEFLKRVLKEAKERGQRVDPGVLAIPAITHQPRRGRA